MNVLLRCVVLSLAAFGLTHLIVSLAVALRWRWRTPGGQAAARADALLRLQLLPALSAVLVVGFTAIGLFRFESRDDTEVLGVSFLAAGAYGAVLAGAILWRLARAQWQTSRLVRAWLAGGTPVALPGAPLPAVRIDTGFPMVAIVGILRPRLVIDTCVLAACGPEELAAIVAHEAGHLRRRDNLRRAALAAVPGLWGARDLPQAWRQATEEAADDLAAASDRDARFHLATALLRVSRLTPAAAATWQHRLPASALYRGEDIACRVRRLVDAHPAALTRRAPWATLTAAALLGAGFTLQHQIHDAMEVVVAFLP